MTKQNSAVLWTVGQDLGKSGKETARSNEGINFEAASAVPSGESSSTLTFVDSIRKNGTTGNLTYTQKSVLVDGTLDSASNNPISNSTVSTALNNLKVFYATRSNTFSDLKAAYDAGRTLMLIDSGLVYQMNYTHKSGTQITSFEFANAFGNITNTTIDTKTYYEFVGVDAWTCSSSGGWSHTIDSQKVSCQDYSDYRVGALQQNDVSISTGDKLVISDASDYGKGVRSDLSFATSASDDTFLCKKGSWKTALPTYLETNPATQLDWNRFTDTKFYSVLTSPTAGTRNSPQGGNVFALVGTIVKDTDDTYTAQLALGDKLYYRHTTGTGSTWSTWKNLEYSAGTDLKLVNNAFSVDTTSTIDSNSTNSFVLGSGGAITYSTDSVAGGFQNRIYGMNQSLAFGNQNTLGVSGTTSSLGASNVVFGYNNSINMGSYNTILGSASNITVGREPQEATKYPLRNTIIGWFNSIGGSEDGEYAHDTIMIGNSLSWSDPIYSPLLLGVYNNSTWRYKSAGLIPLRITGGGTTDNRKNVEVLYSDGRIWSNSGFEVSDDNGSTTYSTRIDRTNDNSHNIIGSGLSSSCVHVDNMGNNRILTYTELGIMDNTSVSHSMTKSEYDSGESKTTYSVSIAQQLLKRIPSTTVPDPYDKNYAPVLELSSLAYGGNVGITMGAPALPAWNKQQAESTTDLAMSWLRVYGNRSGTKDVRGDILPSDSNVPPGNLEVGKLAVKFYKSTELTESNPLIPGGKVGDISFIVGDPTVSDPTITSEQDFYVYDYYSPSSGIPAIPQIHKVSGYITNGYQFCMLITTSASDFNSQTHMLTTPGSFAVLHC